MKVMIYGTSPLCGTGYATAVRYVSLGLKARGHDASIFAWNSHVGPVITWQGVKVWPRANTVTGHELMGQYARQAGADMILAICDPWIQPWSHWTHDHDLPVVFWFPCQSEPVSQLLLDITGKAAAAACYSKWGTEAMRKAGLDGCDYVPLGVDPKVYRPKDRAEAREAIGLKGDLADRFVIGMVAANSTTVPTCRKAFDQALAAFGRFKREVDPDAILYLHTWYTEHQGGIALEPLIRACGLQTNVDVLFPDQANYTASAFGDGHMSAIYNACDVVHQATTAEGFGLPILEAQACGRPVVVTDHSSQPELCAYGTVVDAAAEIWSPQPVDGWVAIPDQRQILRAWRAAKYGGPAIVGTQDDALALARELSWDNVIDRHLLPVLERVHAERAAGKQEPEPVAEVAA